MSAVGRRLIPILILSVLGPVLLALLALGGVLLLWQYLCNKEARRKAEQPAPDPTEVPAPTAPTCHSLGEALRECRLRRGMTQESVAEALNVSRQAVSKWENGSADPTTGNLLALARLYDVSAEELLRAAAGESSALC